MVTDDKGRHVTDLTPADFEVVERGRRQTVRQLTYVRTVTAAPGAPPARATLPSAERTGRVMAIVVDDLGLAFTSIVRTRTLLTRFLEPRLRRTTWSRSSGPPAARERCNSSRPTAGCSRPPIDRVRWWRGLAQFGAGSVGAGLHSTATGPERMASSATSSSKARSARWTTPSAVSSRCPGAKRSCSSPRAPASAPAPAAAASRRRWAASSTAPTARGVVLYAIDPSGLENAAFAGSNGIAQARTPPGGIDPSSGMPMGASIAQARRWHAVDRQGSLEYLSERTGGFAIVNANDLSGGLARIVEDTSGYYLIGFDTAVAPGVSPNPDDVRIKVQRRGTRVRARQGRFGPADPAAGPLPRPGDPLAAAAVSPFSTGAIDVRLTPSSATTATARTSAPSSTSIRPA